MNHPEGRLPEITLKGFLLTLVLSVLLAAANAYLGLFAGMTVSASIPAAVVSMAVLRWFGRSNILENNIVQTGASAGESLAAGAIFTLPALVILGAWAGFAYWEVTLLVGFGGLLGVLFTVPLRRAFITESPLRFPEGTATAQVLKAGHEGAGAARAIAWAGLLSGAVKLGETGLRLWGGVLEGARALGGATFYLGLNLSPALLAVGFIVGLNIALLVFLGGVLNWLVAIPLVSAWQGTGEGTVASAYALWSAQTRYLGVGAMVVGGVWTLLQTRKSLVRGVRAGFEAYGKWKGGGPAERTERDMPMPWVAWVLGICLLVLYAVFQYFTGEFLLSAFMAAVILAAGFLFSAVAAYMAGVVGSSNNPISGVTIATILAASFLLLLLLGRESPAGPAAAILIGAVVCCAAAIAGDNMQDLKAGHIVGATPFRQQLMQAAGVAAAALVMAPVLTLLLEAYGIGVPSPGHPRSLPAPQATLMASVAQGVFQQRLPLHMVFIGMALACVMIYLDGMLERRGGDFRLPVLAVAVGIYLPLQLSVPIALGGVLAWAVSRREGVREAPLPAGGLLFSAGLITGEALMGIFLALPIVWSGDPDFLALGSGGGGLVGLLLFLGVAVLLYRAGRGPFLDSVPSWGYARLIFGVWIFMAITLSVASGKGGVGKSVVASNLGLLLARRGKRVALVDLDVGGANVHILFGMIHPEYTLTDFLYRRVGSLEEVARPFNACPGLYIIPGTGDTLATANMPYARKRRLIRHLKRFPADVVLVDVGPGTNFHSLDFFLMADRHVVVATADPTSVLDLYRFIKLAAIRRVLSAFVARGAIAEALVDRDFSSVGEVLEAAGRAEEDAREAGRQVLKDFNPCLILNRVSGRWRVNTGKLKLLLKEYVGGELGTLGEIPEDEAVERSVRAYLPVSEYAPASPAAAAFGRLADRILDQLKTV